MYSHSLVWKMVNSCCHVVITCVMCPLCNVKAIDINNQISMCICGEGLNLNIWHDERLMNVLFIN